MRAPVLLIASLVATVDPPRAAGQEDFRGADLGRPIRVEDANPIKFREWEIELGSRGEIAEGSRGAEGLLELKTGAFRNAELGVEVEGAIRRPRAGDRTVSGLEAVSAHVLYGVSRETPALPAMAIRVDASTPGIGSGHQDPQFGLTSVLTRSFGRSRLHSNAGYTTASRPDGGDYWRFGIGADYPVGLFSQAILADVYAEIPSSNGPSRVWVDVGTRLQLSNRSVLDLGLATRLDLWHDEGANLEIVIGLSRVFGLGGRVPQYLNPTLH